MAGRQYRPYPWPTPEQGNVGPGIKIYPPGTPQPPGFGTGFGDTTPIIPTPVPVWPIPIRPDGHPNDRGIVVPPYQLNQIIGPTGQRAAFIELMKKYHEERMKELSKEWRNVSRWEYDPAKMKSTR